MPPITIEQTRTGGMAYANPFVGPLNHTFPVRVDVSALDATLVDARGYLKAGVILQRNGLPIPAPTGAAGEVAQPGYGVVVEPIKVAASNAAADLGAAVDIDVSVAVIGAVNRAIAEDILGRAYHAFELDAFKVNGSSPVVLVY